MSLDLAPKIDELREVSKQIDVDLICITKPLLQNHIHDNVVEIAGYNIVRRDRDQGEHGGVCVYVKNAIKYHILNVYFLASPIMYQSKFNLWRDQLTKGKILYDLPGLETHETADHAEKT